jgi:tetratricopeptide (TPR) repeat protein
MPERPWRRRRQRGGREDPPPEGVAQAAPGPWAVSAAATKSEFLRRAADCYLRAGELNQAARCLSRLPSARERSWAAELYLRASEYQLAAEAYADAGRAEASAWIKVHYLGDVASARAILDQNPMPNVPPLDLGDVINVWPGADSPSGRHIRQIGERLTGLRETDDKQVRAGVTSLIGRVLGDTFSYGSVAAALAEIRGLARDGVAARDFPAAFAALDLARQLSDLQAQHSELVELAKRERHEDLHRALARRQVLARCDVAEEDVGERVLGVLTATQRVLADIDDAQYSERTETWGVAIAEAMRRYDQAALIFAAAVRGRRPGAAGRWREWSMRVLHADTSIPADLELA